MVKADSRRRRTPGRFANYFRELAELIDTTGAAPDRDTWIELYGRYDTTFIRLKAHR